MADAPTPTEAPPANNADRSWERPWSLEEMRKQAGNWSLAGDAGLLLYLQDFSKKLITRTHEIEKEVANLVHDSKLTGVRVNNVFNEFMMLANTQFVENRVYDDDEHVEETNEEVKKHEAQQEKTREQREAELIPKVSEAIQLGVNVIEQAFEKLDVVNSDSEDEDESYRVDPILEAKDPYIDRLLPHLIGSPNFMADDDVGLKDISDEESDAGSISESEPEAEGEKSDTDFSDSDTESETGSEKPPAKPVRPSVSTSGSDSEGDLFSDIKKDKDDSSEESSQSDEEAQEEVKKPPVLDFAAELAGKLGGGGRKPPSPTPAGSGDEEPAPKHDKKKGTKKSKEKKKEKQNEKEKKEKDMFGGDSDSEDSLFGGGGGTRFDDEYDDEGDLFGSTTAGQVSKPSLDESDEPEENSSKVKPKARSASGKGVPAGGVSVFGAPPAVKASRGESKGMFDDTDEEDDLFSSSVVSTNKEKTAQKKPADKPAPSKSLFDDEEEEVDDLFASTKKTKEEEEEKKVEEKPPPKKQFPAGAVPMFGPPGAGNPLAAALKKKRQDSHKEEDDDWSDGEKSHSSSVKSSQSQDQRGKTPESKDSIFADELDDSVATETKPKSNSISRNAKTTAGLFDDDEEEDDLFGAVTSKPTTQDKTKAGSPAKQKPGIVFVEDVPEDDLFGGSPASVPPAAAPPKKKLPAGAQSMFGGIDPFAKKKTEPKPDEPISRPASKSISIFGEDDMEEDLFGGGGGAKIATKKETAPTKQGPAKSSIFDDPDDLFNDDEAAGDIFAPKKPSSSSAAAAATAATKTPTPSETKPAADMKKSASALFGDDEEDEEDGDGLFGTKEPAPEPSVPQKKPPVGGVSIFGPGAGLVLPQKPSGGAALDNKYLDKKGQPKQKQGDPLFAGEEDNDDLFTVSKPVEKKPASKPAAGPLDDDDDKKPASKPAAGLLDDDDDNDLFSTGKKTTIPQATDSAQASSFTEDNKKDILPAVVQHPAVSTETKKGPLDEDEDDDDLFSASSKPRPKTEEPPKAEVVNQPKKPVGGVSIFGGVNPFAAKKSPSLSESPGSESSPEDLQKRVPKVDSVESPVPKSPTKAGKIGQLQSRLNINPASMVPGAVASVKEPEPVSIGFDIPAEAQTLQSDTKDRAKIQTKRRPPSRHARKAAAASSASPAVDTTASSRESTPSRLQDIDPDRVPPPFPDSPPRVPSPVATSGSLQSDMFSGDDLFPSNSLDVSPGTKPTPSRTNAPSLDEDEGLFGGAKVTAKKTEAAISNKFDDLFSASPPKLENKQDTAKNAILGDDDDLFGSVPKKSDKSGKKSTKNATKSPAPSSLIDDDDDIFSVKKPKKKADPSPIIDDDDDLFSSPSLSGAKKTTKKQPANKHTEQSPNDDLFASANTKETEKPVPAKPNDDDDDLFASKLDKKKPSKKPMTKDEDLFADKTDIFSDIPTAAPKEKKAKKKASTAPKKTIFKDDIDDIFADSGAVPKPKDKKKKKTTVSDKKGKSDDIFDDPLS